jgi:hypothetical protein
VSNSSYSADNVTEFRGDLNIQKIIYDQVTLCNRARSGDPTVYAECVEQLLLLLPFQQQIKIEEESKDYIMEESGWTSVTMDGDTGSSDPKNPNIINQRKSIRYNPRMRGRMFTYSYNEETDEYTDVKETWVMGGPHWLSPIYRESSYTDPGLLFKKIMRKLQGIGYTHKQDEIQKDLGDVKPDINTPLAKPTPTDRDGNPIIRDKVSEEDPLQNEEDLELDGIGDEDPDELYDGENSGEEDDSVEEEEGEHEPSKDGSSS